MKRKNRLKALNTGGGSGFFGRIFRATISMIVLTAFVLGITFSVKQISTIDADKITGFVSPYLAKIGLDEETAGQVAGNLFERVSHTGMSDGSSITTNSEDPTSVPEGDVLFSIAIISDSHIATTKQEFINNKAHLDKALNLAKERGIEAIVHAGDITNFGETSDLREAKAMLDAQNMTYYVLPGDRDLAASVGISNFLNVFGENKFAFEIKGTKFVLFDNSANYTQISQENMNWFRNEVQDADFVIFSQPLYTESLLLLNYMYMGSSSEDLTENPDLSQRQAQVRSQRDQLLEVIRDSDVKAVFAGDHHRFDKALDKEKPSLVHFVVGATSEVVSDLPSGVLLQPQKFMLLHIYENGGYKTEEILL